MQHLPQTSLATVAVGIAMLVILVGIERFPPRAPAPLVAVAVGIAASGLLGLQGDGGGDGRSHPPGLPSFTTPNLALVEQLWPGALWASPDELHRVHRRRPGLRGSGRTPSEPNRELLATGLANALEACSVACRPGAVPRRRR